jgi:large subunit ribosomal protein L5
MQRSDRLEEADSPETPEAESPAPKATRARRPRAASAASEAPAISEVESPAASEAESPAPKATRARRPRAAPAASKAPATSEAEAPVGAEAGSPPPRARSARKARATSVAAPAGEVATRSARAPRQRPAEQDAKPSPSPKVKRVPRLLEQYRSKVMEMLREDFGYKNVMEIPRLEKVVLNIGMGETKVNPRALESATRDLASITGQKAVITRARKSIAGFKLREGEAIGTMVTLRGYRMYEFLDRLCNASLPRIRDFRGVSRKAFDGRGNYTLGIREQVIFPEVDYGQIDRIRSLQVSIITTAQTDREGMHLLEHIGMPFTREAV